MLAKRCLSPNIVDQYYNILEKYLEPFEKQQKQLANTLPELLTNSKGMMTAVSAKDLFISQGDSSGIMYKPNNLNIPTMGMNNAQNGSNPYGIAKPTSAQHQKSTK